MRYMVTHTLLSSWQHAMAENPYADATTEENPMEDFLKVLRREPREPTEAMQNGMEFEKLVTDIATGRFVPEFETDGTVNKSSYGNGELMGYDKYPRWYDAACKVAEVIRGGAFQLKAKKMLTVAGTDLLLFGVLDVLKAGTIYDIKFSKSYERGKYYGSTQHPAYFDLVPEAREFTYLVSNGSAVYSETYRREDTRSIVPVAADFLEWLDSTGLDEIYRKNWRAF